jgi:chromosome segregation protein
MRLSKLNIAGFKSFPDRAELAFDTGVTAIVGPNGCGKSNVVDAITWVLGEQSAKSLRGERMEDVIFNGSDARKPTATAEVRLKLTEVGQAAMRSADEPVDPLGPLGPLGDTLPLVMRDVEIGRRLYRSGESEYLIDGQVCRLRDVHDLLMDFGLGIKAYAVIEQGKIGQILSSRPTERRSLIEEAAGVTKYKSRRRAAELKLEAAEQNLTRVDDIIFEVEKQRGALRRQAARARRYRRLREELRRWEQVQFAHRHAALAREIEATEARHHAARAREIAAQAHVAEMDAALEALRIGLAEAEAASTSLREQAHAREMEIGRRQQQIEFDTRQIAELGRRADDLNQEVRDLEGRRDPARIGIDAQRDAARRARQALDDAAVQVSESARDYDRAVAAAQAVEREADELRAAVMGAATTLSALRQARENAAAVRDRVALEGERLDAEARDLAVEADRARQDREAAAVALAAAQATLQQAMAARTFRAAEVARLRTEREHLQQNLATRQREAAGLEARLRSLEELDAKRATFGDAARLLLAEAPEAVAPHGAIADHLRVERSYERAVDALLGELLQHVVVDGPEQVTAAFRMLRQRDAGRCGFLMLQGGAGSAAGPVPAPAWPGTRPLRSVVHVTGPYADAITRVLGDALIADSFEIARAVAAEVSVPVATPAGEVFRGRWLVEGGVRQSVHGILETRAEVLDLKERVTAAAVEAHDMANGLMALEFALADAVSSAGAAQDDQHAQEKAIIGFELQTTRADDERARVTRRLDVVATEQGRAAEEARAAERRRDDAAAAIVAHESQHRDAELRLNDVTARLQTARDVAESSLRLVTSARTEQAALVERTSALDAEVIRLETSARELDDRIVGRRAEKDRTDARRVELQASIRDTERLLDADIRAIEALRSELRGLDERLAGLRGQFETHELEIRRARQALDAVRADVTQVDVARVRAVSDLEHLAATCLAAVNATLDQVVAEVARMERDGELSAPARRLRAVSEPDEDEDADAAAPAEAASQAEAETQAAADTATGEGMAVPADVRLTPDDVIADLRRKIEKLGPVNMMAIEQFDELESRHTFLTTQRKDLLDAIQQTGEAIRRIDKTTKERFEEAFASINEKFQQTFTTLFGGGHAGLVLIDLDNDQESGVDIIAQPPGKRLQNVQLLSGGEKALTAMALMFAIFKHRPSPFCLLDEIDAPLDDANIGRFIEMLQGMQGHTQFILITHNRKTMEIANRLYGVTMEEPGVSKLISVQLN